VPPGETGRTLHRVKSLIALSAIMLAAAASPGTEQPSTGAASPAAAIDTIKSPAAPGSATPNLAAAPDGRVYMSWLEPTDSGHALRFATLNGTQWSAPRTISAGRGFFVNWADFPSIVVLDGGRLAAHWLEREGVGPYAYGIRISQSADGGKSWSAPVVPHRDRSSTEHGFVALWQEDGKLGAVWLDGRNFDKTRQSPTKEMMLLSTTVAPTGEPGAEWRLDGRVCDCCQTAAAMTVDGPVVAYRDRSPDEIRDIYVTRRIAGQWTPGVPVHADRWEISACPVNGPSISASGRRVALAWFTAAGDVAGVKLAFSDDAGATFGAPIRVDRGMPAGRVDVALLQDGSALVTWVERTGRGAEVHARRVRRDGSAGTAVAIAKSSAAQASGFPRTAVTGSDVVFAWTVSGRPSAVKVARLALGEFP
jgi:hypothetical protein